MTSDERVAAIRARLDAATPGPWTHYYPNQDCRGVCIAPAIHNADISYPDAELIAHSRDDIPFLLDEREQLFGRVSQLEAVIDAVREWHLQWRRDTRRSMANAELLKVLERAAELRNPEKEQNHG